jgi:hypothetical protein
MKTICTLLFVALVLPAFSGEFSTPESKNQSILLAEVSGELVIGVPNFNMKRYDDFLERINAIPGVRKIDYCPAMEVFLINYDTTVYSSPEEAFRAAENELKGFTLYHKLGTSHEELKKNC